MSEHMALTDAERVDICLAVKQGDEVLFAVIEAILAARTSTATAVEFCEHGFRPEPGRCPAGCTEATHTRFGEPSTATADTDPHALSEAEERELRAEQRGYLIGKQEAATADTGLRERVERAEALIDSWNGNDAGALLIRVRGLLATAAPTTDTGARDE